jgi:hypothetical protein
VKAPWQYSGQTPVIRLHPLSCDCDYRIRWRLRSSITPHLRLRTFICRSRGGASHILLSSHVWSRELAQCGDFSSRQCCWMQIWRLSIAVLF